MVSKIAIGRDSILCFYISIYNRNYINIKLKNTPNREKNTINRLITWWSSVLNIKISKIPYLIDFIIDFIIYFISN